ncbi:MAG: SDR family oxidoreductase [Desulfobacterales bacterium]|nr:MAG: SDR family oxidoreductase [Desulfobacterales bacterium]
MKINYHLAGNVAIVTGGGGAIGGAISAALAEQGVSIAIWDIDQDAADLKAAEINSAGGAAIGLKCDVTAKESLESAFLLTLKEFSTVNFLINCAGGGNKSATTSPDLPFFDLQVDDMVHVFLQNYMGTVISSQLAAKQFVKNNSGVILNISSIAGILPLTRALSYSDAKAAVNSFTKWLAVHMAQNYSVNIRVNAIAPGFILTNQNRFLLIDENTGELTERGRQIFRSVPMARFGNIEEVADAALWLLSERASFITGAVIPVDGGYTAFSGV